MDLTLTISDQDALDAIQHIIDTNGTGEKPEDVILGMIVPQLVAERERQLVSAAPRAEDYPPLAAFLAKKKAKSDAEAAAVAAEQDVEVIP